MIADQAAWTVRSALWFVNTVDGVVAALLGTAQSVGERQEDAAEKPPLAAFRRVASIGAKGAKWSVISVIGLGAILMVGAVIFLPRAKPAVPAPVQSPAVAVPATKSTAPSKTGADVIARRCRAGAYRSFPEIEKAECAGRPPLSSAITGDAK